MPAKFYKPQLAKLVEEVPTEGEYVFEQKLDGMRIIAVKNGSDTTLYSRNKKDNTKIFPEVEKGISKLSPQEITLDGEVVALNDKSISSFEKLQQRLNLDSTEEIEERKEKYPVFYYIFDILYKQKSLIKQPLKKRKEILKEVLKGSPDTLELIDYTKKNGKDFFEEQVGEGREGIIAKKLNGEYLPGKRRKDWQKIKGHRQQELIILGYTEGQGRVSDTFGALLVGYYEDDELKYAGQVGTGFDDETRQRLKHKMDNLERKTSPVTPKPKLSDVVTWVTPKLVGEFKFEEWTKNNLLRQPVYLGLRTDKQAEEVVKEAN